MKKNKPYKEIGNRLKELRGGLSQKVFAKAVGLSERSYQRYEYGERLPNIETIIRISAFCGVPYKKIIGSKQERPQFKSKILEGIDTLAENFDIDVVANKEESKQLFTALHDLGLAGHAVKHKLGITSDIEEYYWIEPRATDAINKINYIFTYASEDVVDFVLDILDRASKMATYGLNVDGNPINKPPGKKKNIFNDKADKK